MACHTGEFPRAFPVARAADGLSISRSGFGWAASGPSAYRPPLASPRWRSCRTEEQKAARLASRQLERTTPALSPELKLLLAVGPDPGEDEVRDILEKDLSNWKNPKFATSVFSGLAEHRLPYTAIKLLHAMLACRVDVNVFHLNAAIAACSKAGEWQLALGLLKNAPLVKCSPNDRSFNAAISACSSRGQWHVAFSLLQEMPEVRVAPSEVSYNAAISSCQAHDDKWQLALRLLCEMPQATLRYSS